jgi:hypothetical protein
MGNEDKIQQQQQQPIKLQRAQWKHTIPFVLFTHSVSLSQSATVCHGNAIYYGFFLSHSLTHSFEKKHEKFAARQKLSSPF